MRQTLTDDFWRLHKNIDCAFPLNLKFLHLVPKLKLSMSLHGDNSNQVNLNHVTSFKRQRAGNKLNPNPDPPLFSGSTLHLQAQKGKPKTNQISCT